MRNGQLRAVGFGFSVHLARFAIIWVPLAVAPLVGISGWYLGLAANVTCVIFAATRVTVRGLWSKSGILVARRGPKAVILLIPLMIGVLPWHCRRDLSGDPRIRIMDPDPRARRRQRGADQLGGRAGANAPGIRPTRCGRHHGRLLPLHLRQAQGTGMAAVRQAQGTAYGDGILSV